MHGFRGNDRNRSVCPVSHHQMKLRMYSPATRSHFPVLSPRRRKGQVPDLGESARIIREDDLHVRALSPSNGFGDCLWDNQEREEQYSGQ